MGALGTRGRMVAGGSCPLCAYRPPSATDELATWREQALARSAAWHALLNRLGWQVYVTNTTKTHSSALTLVGSYHQQALEERGFSR